MERNTTLVVGASGATGKLLVEQLLGAGQRVKVVVRAASNIPGTWEQHERVTVMRMNIAEIPVEELAAFTADCQAVACCLGHNLTLKGIYGKPRDLVTASVRRMCEAIQKNEPSAPIKFVLMSTAGNSNRDLPEKTTLSERIVIGLLRLLLPPHPDNEKAADHLRVAVGKNNPYIEWAVVRPDTLINKEKVSGYTLHASPTRSALFNPGKTSRINVGHFMARLILAEEKWEKWRGQMPVIYDEVDGGSSGG